MPLLLEKLSSSSVPAKRDSLDVLIEAVPIYGLKGIQSQINSIWVLLKEEIYNPVQEDLSTASLHLLTSIT